MSVDWLFPKARWVILQWLFGRPDRDFYVNELIRLAGGGSAHIQRELKQFAEEGLIIRIPVGNQIHYRANPDHPLYHELRSLVLKTRGLTDVLKDSLSSLAGIDIAFVYGSLAKGKEKPDSDVDLMIVGDIRFSDAVGALTPVQDVLLREINPSVYGHEEFRKKLAAGNYFLKGVLRGPKLFLIGNLNDLRRLGKTSPRRSNRRIIQQG